MEQIDNKRCQSPRDAIVHQRLDSLDRIGIVENGGKECIPIAIPPSVSVDANQHVGSFREIRHCREKRGTGNNSRSRCRRLNVLVRDSHRFGNAWDATDDPHEIKLCPIGSLRIFDEH